MRTDLLFCKVHPGDLRRDTCNAVASIVHPYIVDHGKPLVNAFETERPETDRGLLTCILWVPPHPRENESLTAVQRADFIQILFTALLTSKISRIRLVNHYGFTLQQTWPAEAKKAG